jgi:hypothetical protein
MANETTLQNFDPASEIARIELLSKALVRAQVNALKDRLDRIFLENLHSDTSPADNQPEESAASTTLISDLQQDINSLYTEIDDVATMPVEHEHRTRLRSCIEDIEETRDDLRNQALTTVRILFIQSATYLRNRADRVGRHSTKSQP